MGAVVQVAATWGRTWTAEVEALLAELKVDAGFWGHLIPDGSDQRLQPGAAGAATRERHKAAVRIQGAYRGRLVRRRLVEGLIKVNQFTLHARIGSGAQADVYFASNDDDLKLAGITEANQPKYAIKVIKKKILHLFF